MQFFQRAPTQQQTNKQVNKQIDCDDCVIGTVLLKRNIAVDLQYRLKKCGGGGGSGGGGDDDENPRERRNFHSIKY